LGLGKKMLEKGVLHNRGYSYLLFPAAKAN